MWRRNTYQQMDWRVLNLLKGMTSHFCGKSLFQLFFRYKSWLSHCLSIFCTFLYCLEINIQKMSGITFKDYWNFWFQGFIQNIRAVSNITKNIFGRFFWKMDNEIFNTFYIQSNFKSFTMNVCFLWEGPVSESGNSFCLN